MKTFNALNTEESKKNDNWSMVQLELLRENYETMSDQDLATITTKTIAAVRSMLRELKLVRPKKRRERKVAARTPRPLTEKRIEAQKREQKRLEDQQRRNADHERKERSRQREQSRVFKTRKQDLTAMRTIRIDAKTFIYLKPGDDEREIRARYTRVLSKEGYSKIL